MFPYMVTEWFCVIFYSVCDIFTNFEQQHPLYTKIHFSQPFTPRCPRLSGYRTDGDDDAGCLYNNAHIFWRSRPNRKR